MLFYHRRRCSLVVVVASLAVFTASARAGVTIYVRRDRPEAGTQHIRPFKRRRWRCLTQRRSQTRGFVSRHIPAWLLCDWLADEMRRRHADSLCVCSSTMGTCVASTRAAITQDVVYSEQLAPHASPSQQAPPTSPVLPMRSRRRLGRRRLVPAAIRPALQQVCDGAAAEVW